MSNFNPVPCCLEYTILCALWQPIFRATMCAVVCPTDDHPAARLFKFCGNMICYIFVTQL